MNNVLISQHTTNNVQWAGNKLVSSQHFSVPTNHTEGSDNKTVVQLTNNRVQLL